MTYATQAKMNAMRHEKGRKRIKVLTCLYVLLSITALLYASLLVLLYFAQGFVVFPAGRNVWTSPEAMNWDFEEVRLPVGAYETFGWFIPAPHARGVLLFSHGNAGAIADRMESIGIFRELGFDVLVYDYGGYGYSTGSPSEARCYADAMAMWDFLVRQRGIAPERILLFGRSLGGGVACDLASKVNPGAVILESTFISTVRMGKELYPFLPIGLLLRHRFESDMKINRITAPVLVVHSRNDEIVPFAHGEKLYELARPPKTFLEIEGGHNEGFLLSGSKYVDGLRRFVEPLFPPR